MNNKKLQKQIAFEMRRVKRLGNGWRYVPLKSMPEGTKISIFTGISKEIKENTDSDEPCGGDFVQLPAVEYTLTVGIWPTMYITPPLDIPIALKIYNPFLAPSSVLEGNFDGPKKSTLDDNFYNTTFFLTSGEIQRIVIPETPFKLDIKDLRDQAIKQTKNQPKRRRRQYSHSSLRDRMC